MRRSSSIVISSLLALLCLQSPDLLAVQRVWVGKGNNNSWTTPSNWNPSSRPLSGDDLVFPANAQRVESVVDIAGLVLRSVTFTSNAPEANGAQGSTFAIRGQSLSISNGVVAGPGVVARFENTLTLTRPQAWKATGNPATPGSSVLILAAPVNLTGSPLTLESKDDGVIRFVSSLDGAGVVTKTGNGTVELTTANAFTSDLMISAGRVLITHNQALGTGAGATRVEGTGSLALGGGLVITTEKLFLNSSAVGALSAIGTNAWKGNIVLLQQSSLHVTPLTGLLSLSSTDAAGLLTGAGGLTKQGQGSLEFIGAQGNKYVGPSLFLEGFIESSLTGGVSIPGNVVLGDSTTNRLPGANVLTAFYSLAAGQINPQANVEIRRSGALSLGRGGVGFNLAEQIQTLTGEGLAFVEENNTLIISPSGGSTFFGRLNGGGQLIKRGAGALNLNAPVNTLRGGATVEAGSFGVFGSLANCAVDIKSGARLEGDGDVGSVILRGGSEAAPLSSQKGRLGAELSIRGSITFEASTTFRVDAWGTLPSQGNDTLVVDEGVILQGTELVPVFHYVPATGETISVLRKGSFGVPTGTFTGWPEGGVKVVDGIPLKITYRGGSGRDVVLTVGEQSSLQAGGNRVTSGNGNAFVEPDECTDLLLGVQNATPQAVTITSAFLRSITPGVVITQPRGSYGTLAAGASATNPVPYQVRTTTRLTPGTEIRLELAVVTSGNGTITLAFTLPAGPSPENNGGACESCNLVEGTLDATSATTGSVLNQQSEPSSAIPGKACPGVTSNPNLPSVPYLRHPFRNDTDTEALVTAVLTQTDACSTNSRTLGAAAYLGQFNPAGACDSYLGDAGAVLGGYYRPFSFRVPARSNFEVVVTALEGLPAGACASYTLELFGLACEPPRLALSPAAENTMRVEWSTAYPGWQLESTPAFAGENGGFTPVTGTPALRNGKFSLTVPVQGNRFFRLTQ